MEYAKLSQYQKNNLIDLYNTLSTMFDLTCKDPSYNDFINHLNLFDGYTINDILNIVNDNVNDIQF